MRSDSPVPGGNDLSERALGALLLAPAAILLLVVVVYPIATLFWSSLHTADPNNAQAPELWAGLGNYVRAFDDGRFWRSTLNTVLYVVVTVPGALVIGLGLALLANKPFKVKWPVRLGLLLPWALPLVFAGLIFRWFFEYNTGVVNDWLAVAGIEPVAWLSSPVPAFWAICVAIAWKASSFMALVLLAGLQTIPKSLYEAADVDGASVWQQFIEITLPMLRPAIFVALIFRTLDAFRVFDLVYVMTAGGPGTATEPVALYAFNALLQSLRFGYGSAVAVLIFLVTIGFALLYIRLLGQGLTRAVE